MSTQADQVKNAVLKLCPEFFGQDRPGSGPTHEPRQDERALWRHFMNCLLSSQVPYELACVAAQEIEDAGILVSGRPHIGADELSRVLARPMFVDGKLRRYRFYNIKASQLSRSWMAVNQAGGLAALVSGFRDDHSAREWLVRMAPGLGPKQASMFLREIGFSQNLAVLDRHTLDYMALVGICETGLRTVSSMRHYLALENQLRKHAQDLGYSVGHLDRAIWVVMRVRASAARGYH